jgi:UTP-glucose-1-phosphate uridylyltransferase
MPRRKEVDISENEIFQAELAMQETNKEKINRIIAVVNKPKTKRKLSKPILIWRYCMAKSKLSIVKKNTREYMDLVKLYNSIKPELMNKTREELLEMKDEIVKNNQDYFVERKNKIEQFKKSLKA